MNGGRAEDARAWPPTLQQGIKSDGDDSFL